MPSKRQITPSCKPEIAADSKVSVSKGPADDLVASMLCVKDVVGV